MLEFNKIRNLTITVSLLIFIIPLRLIAQSFDTLVQESNKSTFQITSASKDPKYKTTEYTYQVLEKPENRSSDFFLCQFKTTTIKQLFSESQDRTIEVTIAPFENLSDQKYHIVQKCDRLQLFPDKYKTIKYGCCASPSQLNLFDFENNLIITGSDTIYECYIPNHVLRFYYSYEASFDTLSLGTFHITFNDTVKYNILFTGEQLLKYDGGITDLCPLMYPKIIIEGQTQYLGNGKLEYFPNETVKSVSDLNFSFTLTFNCDDLIKPFQIPIIAGKPFALNEENQKIKIR